MPTPPEADLRYHDQIADVYFDRWELPIQRLTRRVEARWLQGLLRGQTRPKVLLAGSGGGRELEALLPLHAEVCAVDYSERALEVGRARWGDVVEWHHRDVHDLSDLPADTFDAAVALSSFNYFVDPPAALASIASRLRPGGLVVVSSLNAEHPTERARKPVKVTRQPFTERELRDMAYAQGLERIRTRGLRFLVDRYGNDSRRTRLALRFEPALARLAGPRRCKWIWLIAARPE